MYNVVYWSTVLYHNTVWLYLVIVTCYNENSIQSANVYLKTRVYSFETLSITFCYVFTPEMGFQRKTTTCLSNFGEKTADLY